MTGFWTAHGWTEADPRIDLTELVVSILPMVSDTHEKAIAWYLLHRRDGVMPPFSDWVIDLRPYNVHQWAESALVDAIRINYGCHIAPSPNRPGVYEFFPSSERIAQAMLGT